MARRISGCSAVMVALLGASSALAQETETAAEAAPAASGAQRKDPRGVKGISPFWESVKTGDAAYAARDFDNAIVSYRNALKKDPQNPMGHYRIGSAHLAKGDLKEARVAWEAAQRFAGADPVLKAKVLFVLADLAEREKEFAKAINGWNAYEAHAEKHPKANVYPASAAERKKRIAEWQTMQEQYKAVKERIAKRLDEAEESVKKSR